MTKGKFGAAFAVLAVIIGLWLWKSKGGEATDPVDAGVQAAADKSGSDSKASDSEGGGKAPQSMPSFSWEDDPKGSLRLEGQVIDDTKDPVAGATVVLSSNPQRTTKTEEDGSFHFDELVRRTYHLTARKDALVAEPATQVLTKTSDPVILELRPGATIAFEVSAADSRKPISGGIVELRGLEKQSASTDSAGKAQIHGVTSGWHKVTARADGRAPAASYIQVPKGATEPVVVKFALAGGFVVEGSVVSHDGKPVAGAAVWAESSTRLLDAMGADEGVESDRRGQFRIPAVAKGTYRFSAKADGQPAGISKPVGIDGAITGVEIRLGEPVTLTGLVVDKGNNPVPYATVKANAAGDGMDRMTMADGRQVYANDAGRFEIRGLPKGAVSVVAQSELASSEVEEVDLKSKSKADITLTLSIEGVISGVVVDSQGEPVGDVQVNAFPDFWGGEDIEDFMIRGGSSARTDPGGRFAFRGLPDGKYRVRATRSQSDAQGWGTENSKTAKVGDTNVRLILDPDGGIKGRLKFADGSVPPLFSVITGMGRGALPVASPDGSFEIPGVAAGSLDIRFVGPNFADRNVRDVEIKPNKVTDMGDIVVVKGRQVSGRVLDANGSPAAGAKVVTGMQIVGNGSEAAADFGSANDQMQKIRRTETDMDGYYSMTGLTRDALVIVADHTTGRARGQRIPAGQEMLKIDLRLRPLGALNGVVTKDGKPAGQMQVLATLASGVAGQIVGVQSGPDGAFSFDKLGEGEYSLKALSGGRGMNGPSGGAEVTVVAGKTATANIDIVSGNVTLEVTIAGKGGAKVETAQMFLFEGEHSVSISSELTALFTQAKGSPQMTFALAGTATFNKIVPGTYSLCAIPIGGNMSDPKFMQRVQEHSQKLKVYCETFEIAESPAKLARTMTLPPMEPLPEQEPETP